MATTTTVRTQRSVAGRPRLDPEPGSQAGLRLGAAAGALGFVLQFFLEGFAHPSSADPNNSRAAFAEYAASTQWTAVHVGQFIAVLLVSVALLIAARTMGRQRGVAGTLAFLGGAGSVLVVAVFAVQMAVDGVALKAAIDTWMQAAPAERAAAFFVADGLRAVEKGLSAFFHLGNGFAMVCLGLAAAMGTRFPRWLGWVGVAAGLGVMAGGVSTAHTGFSAAAGMILLAPMVLSVVFISGLGVVMWRGFTATTGDA